MNELLHHFLSSPIKIVSIIVIIMSIFYMSLAVTSGFADFSLVIFIPTVLFLALIALSIGDPVISTDKIPQMLFKSFIGCISSAMFLKFLTPPSDFSYQNMVMFMPMYFFLSLIVTYKKEVFILDKKLR